jgi:hypothetical protein
MKFENPVALWGLASLLLLVLFSLWRQAAARVTVPSLSLWKRIPERNPPIRALRRPRWRLELLLQALAISAAVLALAGPSTETDQPKPRRIALVFDTSARLRAGDRLERMKSDATALLAGPLKHDQVRCFASTPTPMSIPGPEFVNQIDAHVDLEPLLAAARATSDVVVVYSDRPVDGAQLALYGAPADNAGIVEFSASDDEVFVRIVQHGPPRALPIELVAGEARVRETLAAGQRTWTRKGDFSKAASVRVSLDAKDSFPLDDVVEATRMGSGAARVTLKGRPEDGLVRAFRSVPGVTVDRGEGPARISVGYDEPPGPAEVRVWLYSSSGRLEGAPVIAKHPLMADLEKRGAELVSADLGPLPPSVQGGIPLITVGGQVAAAIKGGEVHLAINVHKWQQGLASFPIFWVNVLDYAARGASGLQVARTGRPLKLPPASMRSRARGGPDQTIGPDDTFMSWKVGDYKVGLPDGDPPIRVNLLDERESDTAGETRPLAWTPAPPAESERVSRGWAGPLAWSAVIFLVLAWLLQLRPE